VNAINTDDISHYRILRATDTNTNTFAIGAGWQPTGGTTETSNWSMLCNYFAGTTSGSWFWYFKFDKTNFSVSVAPGTSRQGIGEPIWDPQIEHLVWGNGGGSIYTYDMLAGGASAPVKYNFGPLMQNTGVPNNFAYASNLCLGDDYNLCIRTGTQDREFNRCIACIQGFDWKMLDVYKGEVTPLALNGNVLVVAGDPEPIPNWPPNIPMSQWEPTGVHNMKMDQGGRFIKITINQYNRSAPQYPPMLFWDMYAPLDKAFMAFNMGMVPNIGGHQANQLGQFLNEKFVIREITGADGYLSFTAAATTSQNMFTRPAGVSAPLGGLGYFSWANQRRNMQAPVATFTSNDSGSTVAGGVQNIPGMVFGPVTTPGQREITPCSTDNPPNGVWWRACHHWGRSNGDGIAVGFGDGVFPNLSRDGKYILFSSTMANTLGDTPGGSNRNDLFILELK
jgi:hypothetical protein